MVSYFFSQKVSNPKILKRKKWHTVFRHHSRKDFWKASSRPRWRRQWQPTPVFLPGKSQGRGSLVGCSPWDHTESDTTEATQQQQQQQLAKGSRSFINPTWWEPREESWRWTVARRVRSLGVPPTRLAHGSSASPRPSCVPFSKPPCVCVSSSCPPLRPHGLYSPPGSSVHKIFWAKILECGLPLPTLGIFPTEGLNHISRVSSTCQRVLYPWAPWDAPCWFSF